MGYYGGTIIRGKVDRHTSILREAMYQLTRIVQNKFHYVEFLKFALFVVVLKRPEPLLSRCLLHML